MPVEINATARAHRRRVRLLCLCHDITDRVNTRRELQNARLELERRVERRTAQLARANEQIQSRARQQESVADLGRRALAGADLDELMREAVETVCAVLGVDCSAVVEHADPESDQLVLRALTAWPDATRRPGRRHHRPRLPDRLRAGQPRAGGLRGLAHGDAASASRHGLRQRRRQRHDRAHRRRSAALRTHRRAQPQPRRFTPDDIYFLQCIANVLAAAIERKRSEEIVRLAQQGAVSANNAKIEFLSRMSHELRTPLNAILGFSQLLEIERLDAGQRESVEQITRAGRHLLELVNEVLDISRIDSGNMSLTPEPLAVDELLREALDLIRPLADARRIELALEPGAAERAATCWRTGSGCARCCSTCFPTP